jgi:hypothetical protein
VYYPAFFHPILFNYFSSYTLSSGTFGGKVPGRSRSNRAVTYRPREAKTTGKLNRGKRDHDGVLARGSHVHAPAYHFQRGAESDIIAAVASWLRVHRTPHRIFDEALKDCRLCRILKDFLDQTEGEARVRRQRLQVTSQSEGTYVEERVRFVLRLSNTQFTTSAPILPFSSILRFRPTTNPGKSAQ